MPHPDNTLLGLGIQQPWAELILRGVKTIEVRKTPVTCRTIYLYASKKMSLLEDAQLEIARHALEVEQLPRGLIVGTVDIIECRRSVSDDAERACVSSGLLQDSYSWVLARPVRLQSPLTPRYIPYGMWFYPFQRKGDQLS